jgi:hypothetical protein
MSKREKYNPKVAGVNDNNLLPLEIVDKTLA